MSVKNITAQNGLICFGVFDIELIYVLTETPNSNHYQDAACLCTNMRRFNPYGKIVLKNAADIDESLKMNYDLPFILSYTYGKLIISDGQLINIAYTLDRSKTYIPWAMIYQPGELKVPAMEVEDLECPIVYTECKF